MSPEYLFKCQRCDTYEDVFFKFDDEKIAQCKTCEAPMRREYQVSIKADIQPYYDKSLGYVTSRQDKESKLKAKGLAVYEKGCWKSDNPRDKERYEHVTQEEEQIKDKYRHMIKTGKLDNPIIAKNVGL